MARHGRVNVQTVADVKRLVGAKPADFFKRCYITPDDAFEILKLDTCNRGKVSQKKIQAIYNKYGWLDFSGIITLNEKDNVLEDGGNRLYFIAMFPDPSKKFGVQFQFDGSFCPATDRGTHRSDGNALKMLAGHNVAKYPFYNTIPEFDDDFYQIMSDLVKYSEPANTISDFQILDFINANTGLLVDIVKAGLTKKSKVKGVNKKGNLMTYVHGAVSKKFSVKFVAAYRAKLEDARLGNKAKTYGVKAVDAWDWANVAEVLKWYETVDNSGSTKSSMLSFGLHAMLAVKSGQPVDVNINTKTGIPFKTGI